MRMSHPLLERQICRDGLLERRAGSLDFVSSASALHKAHLLLADCKGESLLVLGQQCCSFYSSLGQPGLVQLYDKDCQIVTRHRSCAVV